MKIITKSALKFIKSLQLKKNRIEHQRFLVEGTKSVQELLQSDFEIDFIAGTQDYIDSNKQAIPEFDIHQIKPSDINSVGSYKNNNSVIAVVKIPQISNPKLKTDEYVLALDDVRDPGNLGTIIRIADWYGITQIIASATTADFFNPKVISASMGSFTRVKMAYLDLHTILQEYKGSIYGALMDGISLHDTNFAKAGVIVMGNESIGVSQELQSLLTDKITIPRYGAAESLNVGIATAVVCDRMRSLI